MGYESQQELVDKAKNLSDQFFGKTRMHNHPCCVHNYGVIFAFPNEAGKLDTLIANGSKLVYKAMNQVFVSNDGKVVLKTPTEVIVSGHNRKSLVIKNAYATETTKPPFPFFMRTFFRSCFRLCLSRGSGHHYNVYVCSWVPSASPSLKPM